MIRIPIRQMRIRVCLVSLAMPPDAAAVRQYALAHLLAMGKELDDEQLDDLVTEMQSRGISNARLLLEVPMTSGSADAQSSPARGISSRPALI